MKKLIILLLTLTLILGVFVSCDNGTSVDSSDTTSAETSSSPSEDTTTDTGEETTTIESEDATTEISRETTTDGEIKYVTDYEVKKVGDQWYMVFDSYVANPADQTFWPPHIYFNSLESLKSDILNHRLTLAAMNTVVTFFTRDDIGIPIFDLDNMYTLSINGHTVAENNASVSSEHYWTDGECYMIVSSHNLDIAGEDSKFYTRLHILSKEKFEYEYSLEERGGAPKIIETENKIVKLFEGYPMDAYMFVNEGEIYYSYLIESLGIALDEEMLLLFGVEKCEE